MIKLLKYLKKKSFCIFLFHGVIAKNNYGVRNYTKKHIEKDIYYFFLKELIKLGNAISMDDFIYYKENLKDLPPNAFAITFDDGFENNYKYAAPILDDLKIPATFYVATKFIEKNLMSWIDQIEFIVDKKSNVNINLPWGEFRLTDEKKSKIMLLDSIRYNVKNNVIYKPSKIVKIIYDQLNVEIISSGEDEITKMMSWKQVTEINNNKLFNVGGHSHSHNILAFLSENEMRNDINLSIKLLFEKGSLNTHHYSYPEGLKHCYNNSVIKHLKQKGIKCCPTAIDGTNNLDSDLFQLKRIMM